MHRRPLTLIIGSAAALLAPLGTRSDAATAPVTARYLVSTEVDTPNASSAKRELLTIVSAADRLVVTVANGSTPQSFSSVASADGELAAATSEQSVICYNLAQAMLSSYARRPADAFSVPVVSLGRVIPVPLSLAARETDGATTIDGAGDVSGVLTDGNARVPAGVAVRAHVVRRDGALDLATFVETTIAGNDGAPVNRTTCSVARATTAPSLANT